jgi:hypothetical protein
MQAADPFRRKALSLLEHPLALLLGEIIVLYPLMGWASMGRLFSARGLQAGLLVLLCVSVLLLPTVTLLAKLPMLDAELLPAPSELKPRPGRKTREILR